MPTGLGNLLLSSIKVWGAGDGGGRGAGGRLGQSIGVRERAYRGADLAILRGHAVSVVQVGKGLGRPPGLQVPRHAHRGPHFRSIQGVARSEEVLWTPALSLGVRNKASHLVYHGCTPALPAPALQEVSSKATPFTLHGFCSGPHSLSATGIQCYKLSAFFFQVV